MVSPGVTPAGNNSVLRTGLGGTQSATMRANQPSAYRNLSSSILHSALIIFHSSPPCSPCLRERPAWMAKVRRLLGPFFLHQTKSPAPLETRGLVSYSVTD